MEYLEKPLRYGLTESFSLGKNGTYYAEASTLVWAAGMSPNYFVVVRANAPDASVWKRDTITNQGKILGWKYSSGDSTIKIVVWND